MIRINQIKMELGHTEDALKEKVAKHLRVRSDEFLSFSIAKKSIDARKKPIIFLTYSVDISLSEEKEQKLAAVKNLQVSILKKESYVFPITGKRKLKHPPVIIGSGPAGLFCTYLLAKHGYQPILFERGECVENRTKSVDRFWETGELNPKSNVQFGEGGAGTFSDGKLNTLVKDKNGRNKEVLNILHLFGAKEDILYESKPHIGTDVLIDVVRNMRQAIIDFGGQVFFESQLTDVFLENQNITGIEINKKESIPCEVLVLAIGHSARDTFELCHQKGIPMEAKSFAVGLRAEHLQKEINFSQHGMEESNDLPAASYKVTAQSKSGRGVYSFCMCPGGYVVNASSEEGRLAINGMSYQKRDGANANSAIIIAVTPEDFESTHPLAGVFFQRELEERAYKLGNGKVPVQRLLDFKENRVSKESDLCYAPAIKGAYKLANVRELMPEAFNIALLEGMEAFGRMIKGFDNDNVILSGMESRTSSPVRMHRDESMQSMIRGLYPCGEGAGYAGGITSAAMDGMKVAEKIAEEFLVK